LISASLSPDLRTASTASPRRFLRVGALLPCCYLHRRLPPSRARCSLHSPSDTGFIHTKRAEPVT
jgi:hypothetical protein